MRVCGPSVWGPPKDRTQAHRVFRKAIELGVNFFDTADSYGPYVDEELIAEALHPYPQGLVIATKGGLVRPSPARWDEDGRPEHLKRAIDGSLERLKLERIDLYQLHAPDPRVPFMDSVGALAEAQRAGKIRHIGLSNVELPSSKRRASSSTSSRCRTNTTSVTANPSACSSAARSSASLSSPGTRLARGACCDLRK